MYINSRNKLKSPDKSWARQIKNGRKGKKKKQYYECKVEYSELNIYILTFLKTQKTWESFLKKRYIPYEM